MSYIKDSGRPLTLRMRTFAELYTGTGTGKDAAVAAGYKESSATFVASKLLTDPRVIAIIDARINKKGHAASMSRAELQAWWAETIKDTNVEMQYRQKAGEHLARSLGMFINRLQVSADISRKLPAGLTADELRSLARGVVEVKALPASIELQTEDGDDEPSNATH